MRAKMGLFRYRILVVVLTCVAQLSLAADIYAQFSTGPDPGNPIPAHVRAEEALTLDLNSTVQGAVHSNGSISVGSGATVDGDASAVGTIQNNGTISGTVTSSAAYQELPAAITPMVARSMADQIYEGSQDFYDLTVSGTIYVEGDVRFFGSLDGSGSVIASGNIEVAASSSPPSSGNGLSLQALQALTVLDNHVLHAALDAGGDITLGTGVVVEGSVLGRGEVRLLTGAFVGEVIEDSSPPYLVNLTPVSGSWIEPLSPTISAGFEDEVTGVDPTSVVIRLNGAVVTSDAQVTSSGFSLVPASPLDEGGQSVGVEFSDMAGNAASETWYFGVDQSAPHLVFTAPAEEVQAEQPEVGVVLFHSDSGVGVDLSTVVVDLDGQPVSCSTDEESTLCQVQLPATGQYTLGAAASDVMGHAATLSHQVNFGLDLLPPSISVNSPVEGSVVSSGVVSVAGTATDDVGVVGVTVNGEQALLGSGTFTADITVEPGPQEVVAVVTDAFGRQATATLSVTVDVTAPGVIVDRPSDGAVIHDEVVLVEGRYQDDGQIDSIVVDSVGAQWNGGTFNATVPLQEGMNTLNVQATDEAGNVTSVPLVVERFSIPSIQIDSPADLAVVAATGVDVAGNVASGVVSVEVNGVNATLDGDQFLAEGVPLIEGGNVLTVTAENAFGHLGTASVNVVRDLSPPRLVVDYPGQESRLFVDTVDVSGLVNDIVAGTVNASEATVTVNGQPATVSNRGFLAEDVPLVQGANLLTVRAEDESGNVALESLTVYRSQPTEPWLSIVSGDRQIGVVGEGLAAPLVVEAKDPSGQPLQGESILFKVSGDGHFANGGKRFAAVTDAGGQVTAQLTLGSRAGVGAQGVEVFSSGFAGVVQFKFDALAGAADTIVVDAGDQQYGIVGRPLPRPVVATVIDAGANRLAGIPVRFSVVAGSGTGLDGQNEWIVVTDTDGRAITQFVLGNEVGNGTHVLEASIDGFPALGVASFTAAGVVAGPAEETTIRGVVLDNTNQPVEGATLRILDSTLTTTTDAEGHFLLSPVPVGTLDLIVDGSTVQRPGSWPDLEFTITTVPGHENDLGRPIFLLPLNLEDGVVVNETQGATLELPEIPGFALKIEPGSVTFPGGSKSGLVSVTAVHADRVPMVPNFGQQPRLIVTIQPAGARFDPPARLTLPNVEGLSPGQVTEFYSFDHDLGHFVSIGPGTVSEDGSTMTSDPGVGILKAGWHCGGNPAAAGTAHDCPECQLCIDNRCIADDAQTCGDEDECTVNDRCSGGSCTGDPIEIHSVKAYIDGNVDDRTCFPEPTKFRADVVQENCEELEYTWDFGDGTTSTEASPEHVFAAPGTYVVTVLVSCAQCSLASQEDTLIVEVVEKKTYELEYMNFIPVQVLIGPANMCGFPNPPDNVYRGDNRGYSPGSDLFRTRSTITVVPEEACSPSGIEVPAAKTVNPTFNFCMDALDDGVLDAQDEDEQLLDCHLLNQVATAPTDEFSVWAQRVSPTAVKTTFTGASKNPIPVLSFAIDWELEVTVDSETEKWTIEGKHDCYPAHEAYINGEKLHRRLPNYNNFVTASTCLFPPMNIIVSDEDYLP